MTRLKKVYLNYFLCQKRKIKLMIKNWYDSRDAQNSRGSSSLCVADKDLGERVYTSKLIGKNPDLVMHGGGNTSVKVERSNLFG